MKLVDKIKNLFIEEVEEEKPIKKEVIKIEIPSPVEQTQKEVAKVEEDECLPDSLGLLKKEEKCNSVVFFDDKDFDTLTISQNFKNKSVVKREGYNNKEVKEEKKIFKATPIISPIYGILDKNYRREDVTPKKENHSLMFDLEDVTVEDVRKKAFGTLEDELETTLFSRKSVIVNKEEVIEKDNITDMFEELEQEANYISNEVDEDTIEMDLLSELQAQTHEANLVEEAMDVQEEDIDLKENDLFNLIDSMYDKGEDE